MGRQSRRRRERRKARESFDMEVNPAPAIDLTKAERIRVAVEPGAKPQECWHNVRRKVGQDGGRAVYGWTVHEPLAGVFRLVAHTVWEAPTGERVDITPDSVQDPFIEDPQAGPCKPVAYMLTERTTPATCSAAFAMMEHERKDIERLLSA